MKCDSRLIHVDLKNTIVDDNFAGVATMNLLGDQLSNVNSTALTIENSATFTSSYP